MKDILSSIIPEHNIGLYVVRFGGLPAPLCLNCYQDNDELVFTHAHRTLTARVY